MPRRHVSMPPGDERAGSNWWTIRRSTWAGGAEGSGTLVLSVTVVRVTVVRPTSGAADPAGASYAVRARGW
ncbi:hypothetical protein GCM10022197_15740 [Microlunatus spumicola]|uniref:Uncharacterized protein n=1 Tax=Microlunatus spumicola TaxID=81499 RepID=A0ABP6X557_9ACTN